MIPKEILEKVRFLEIQTRHLVNDIFGGEYHSVFKGQGMEFAEVREYLPGDVQADSLYTSADIVYLVNYTFKGGPSPQPCAAAGDANCDWTITASDVIYLVNHIFKGGPPPCDS